jgi:hypothetical protein
MTDPPPSCITKQHNDYDKYERKYEKQYGGYETYSAEEEAYGHHGGPEPHGAAYNPHYEQVSWCCHALLRRTPTNPSAPSQPATHCV